MASKIWVVLQHREGRLTRMSREAIGAAQKLAETRGESAGEIEAIVLGHGISELAAQAAAYELAAVRTGDHGAFATYTPGAYVSALAATIRAGSPDFVIFPHTYQAVDFVPRLAQQAGAGLLPEVTAFETGEDGILIWERPILGGKLVSRVRVKGEGTVLVSIQSGAFPADEARSGTAEVSELELTADLRADREILGVEEVAGERVDLTKAEIIVAVGRGIGGEDKMKPVEDLAAALGAEIAASRPVIDNGWLPRDRQIGSSGQTVAPKLYLALGVSGAIQHVVGMKGSKTVVAVNKDPSAPIFNLADYGIVGDLHEILPALTAAVLEAREG